ncbi:hypothetical protein TNCV_4331731 [Trichonephila clavipes]|nr:hypothetical protein TNCV_4331731 [Trichonephila clavipes]
MNPIEHVWDALGRRVAGRQLPPQTLKELERTILEEWDRIPKFVINSLMDSMPKSSRILLLNIRMTCETLFQCQKHKLFVNLTPLTHVGLPMFADGFGNNPCNKMLCTFGSQCLVDESTNRAYCRCGETCSEVFAPVCGKDGVTYSSECQLRLSSCTQQRRILVLRQGPCGK